MGMQSEENEDKLDLAISPKGKSVGGDEGNKLRNPHWRSFGQNLAVSVKDLKLRRELLRKCMTEQEYETTNIGDLASIPMDIAQKYRVNQMKKNRKSDSEKVKKQSLRNLQRKRLCNSAMTEERKLQRLKRQQENAKILRKMRGVQHSKQHRNSMIQHHQDVSNQFDQLSSIWHLFCGGLGRSIFQFLIACLYRRRRAMEARMKRSLNWENGATRCLLRNGCHCIPCT